MMEQTGVRPRNAKETWEHSGYQIAENSILRMLNPGFISQIGILKIGLYLSGYNHNACHHPQTGLVL